MSRGASSNFGKAMARRMTRLIDWSPQGRVTARTLAAAIIGVSGPILFGLAVGRPTLGLTMGLGALLLSGGGDTGPAHRWRAAAASFVMAVLSVGAALLIVTSPAPDLAMVGLAFAAALFSGFSRSIGPVAIRTIILTVLSVTLLDSRNADQEALSVIFVLGAGWNILVRTILAEPAAPRERPEPPRLTSRQLWANWRRSLSTVQGWQFPLRLAGGLAAACALRDVWPDRHFGWIILTTALLTQRPLEPFPAKILQRAVGTLAGVGLAGWLLSDTLKPEAATALIAGLVALAFLARPRSYLLYTSLSTPIVLLVMDLGKALDPHLSIDRLLATLVAAAIVLIGNRAAIAFAGVRTP